MFAVYLYCLARADALPALDGPGIDGDGPLNLIPFKNVVAAVSDVRRNDFIGPAAESRMRDLTWVGPVVCRHEAIVERVMRSSPVLPAGFAVLFSSRTSLASWLERHHDTISRALDRFTDHEEWAVKGTLIRRTAEARCLAVALARHSDWSSSPGTRYFEEQRIRAGIGEDLDAWLSEVGARIATALLDCAVELRERPVQPAGAADLPAAPAREDGTRILNWAFLVPRSRTDEFGAQVERINGEYAEHGLVLTLSGPWPPYSFCPPFEPEPPQ